MYDFLITLIGESMMCFGAFGLGWYLRKPPVYGRIIGTGPRSCDSA